jgi:hypothetical protein
MSQVFVCFCYYLIAVAVSTFSNLASAVSARQPGMNEVRVELRILDLNVCDREGTINILSICMLKIGRIYSQ